MARSRMDENGQAIYDALGDEIRRARKASGRTQDWLAEAARIADQTTLSDYERGRTRISLDVLGRIEDALDLGRGDLLIRAKVVDAKLVPTSSPAASAIEKDPELDVTGRAVVMTVYEYCVAAAQGREDSLPAESGLVRQLDRAEAALMKAAEELPAEGSDAEA